MKFKALFIMITILLATQFGVAQEAIVVYEGAETTHSVDNNPGNAYLWEVFKNFNPDVPADPTEFYFTGSNTTNTVTVHWIKAGIYYLKVTETDANGCTNVKALAVSVVPDNRTIGFISTTSSICQNGDDNGFVLPLSIKNSSGEDLDEIFFPLDVSFTVNGRTFSQSVSYEIQELIIQNNMFSISPGSNTTVLVEITEAEDKDGNEITPSANKLHTRTIFTTPEIEFTTSSVSVTQGDNFNHQVRMIAGNGGGSTYSWSVTPAGGTSTDLSVITSNIATILWDGAVGNYTLSVEATDVNGCVSNVTIQTVQVAPPIVLGDLIFSDAYSDDVVCSDLSSGEEGSTPPENTSTFEIDYLGDANLATATITILNPEGNYVGLDGQELTDQLNPEITIDNTGDSKQIQFSVNNAWENTENSTVSYEISLVRGELPDGNLVPGASGKNMRYIFVLSKPVVQLLNVPDTIKLNAEYAFEATDNDAYTYLWWYVDDGGNRTDFSSNSNKTEAYLWDTEGSFTVYVQVTDTGGCLSEIVSDQFVVVESGSGFYMTAGTDTLIGSCEPYQLEALVSDTTGLTYSWQPDIYLDDPNQLNPIFTPGSSTTYTLTVTTASGTSYSDTVRIDVSEIYADAGEDFIIEEGTTALLDGTGSFGAELEYLWSTENGTIESGANTPNPIISSAGTYYLQVTDSFNCTANDSVIVSRVSYAPIARDDYDTTEFQTEVRIPVLANDEDPDGDLDPNSLAITQFPVNGTVFINYDDYTISYMPNNGFIGNDVFEYQICDLTNLCDNARVYVLVTPVEFLIPEAFTPNGDNINDYFEIKGIQYYPNNRLTIVNRWGKTVYDEINYGIDTNPKFWDGTNTLGDKSDLPTGTYFYVLDLGNGQEPIAGSIYIDR